MKLEENIVSIRFMLERIKLGIESVVVYKRYIEKEKTKRRQHERWSPNIYVDELERSGGPSTIAGKRQSMTSRLMIG